MSFPDDPRDLKVSFAFGHSDAEDPTGVTFERVAPGADEGDPGPVLGGITLTRGRVGDSSLVDPTRIELALRDTDGDFSPRNVTGAHYGQLRNGTPVQVSVDIGAGDVELATAFVPEWNPTWRGPDIDDRVSITALGILAFLGRDQEVKSALRRAFEVHPDVVAYWHMEDEGGTFASGLPGGSPLTLTGEADFASAADRKGSAPLPVFTATTAIHGTVDATFVDRWFLPWLIKFEATPATRVTLLEVIVEGGSADRWVIEADSTTLYMTGYLNGATVYSDTGAAANLLMGESGWIGLQASVVDGIGFDLTIYDLSTTSVVGCQGTDGAIVAGSVKEWRVPASAELEGIPMGHFGVFLALPDDILIPNGPEPLNGYDGETAFDRVLRLCDQNGIPVQTTGDDFVVMGPQLPGTTLALLRECEAADHGVLCERRDGRLGFDGNSGRYNAGVALTLDYGTEAEPGDISNLRQLDDNRDMRNRVTVTRAGGTSVTVKQADGPVGTDEIGVRPLPVTLNLASDDQVPFHAGWLLRAGTINKPRYVILLDLRANPSLRASVIGLDLGSRIQIAGAPSKHVGPDDLDLIVEGERMYLDAGDWIVTLWCEPYEAWRVQQLTEDPPDDDLLDGWLIPDSCALNAGVDTTEDTWLVDIEPLMTTDADDFPCRVSINGEEFHVTACSGASSPQTWTVTRSVNGVTKSHEAGDPIEFLDALVDSL